MLIWLIFFSAFTIALSFNQIYMNHRFSSKTQSWEHNANLWHCRSVRYRGTKCEKNNGVASHLELIDPNDESSLNAGSQDIDWKTAGNRILADASEQNVVSSGCKSWVEVWKKQNAATASSIRHVNYQRALASFSHCDSNSNYRNSVKVSFGPFRIHGPAAVALRIEGIRVPTPIQSASMIPIFNGESVIMQAQTGEGKTLAYLLPLLFRHQPFSNKLQTLILTPTRELAIQLSQQIKCLHEKDDQPVQLLLDDIYRDFRARHAALLLNPRCQFIVATADYFRTWLRAHRGEGSYEAIAGIRHLVLEETDRLLNPLGQYASHRQQKMRKRHPPSAASIVKALLMARISKGKKELPQFIGSSATLGRCLIREVSNLLNIRECALGPRIIRVCDDASVSRRVGIPQQIKHFCVEVPSDISCKMEGLAHIVKFLNPSRPVAFVQNCISINFCKNTLQGFGLRKEDVMLLHEALGFYNSSEKRAKTVDEVLDFHTLLTHKYTTESSHIYRESRQDKSLKPGSDCRILKSLSNRPEMQEPLPMNARVSMPLLLSTMQSARGLHLNEVDMVFIVGPPSNADEYQHISGRTGRQGRHGSAVLIGDARDIRRVKSWQKMLGIVFEDLVIPSVVGMSRKCTNYTKEDLLHEISGENSARDNNIQNISEPVFTSVQHNNEHVWLNTSRLTWL